MSGGEAQRAEDEQPVGLKRRDEEWTKLKRRRFLDHLAGTCNARDAARVAKSTEQSALALRSRDAQFAERWDAALSAGEARIRGLLIERCLLSGGAGAEGEPRNPDPSTLDTDLALRLLAQHRRGAERGPRQKRITRQRTTMEETDAAILKQLKGIATRKRGQ